MCQESFLEVEDALGSSSKLNMFTLISSKPRPKRKEIMRIDTYISLVLHSNLFHVRSSILPQNTESLERGLRNWIYAWERQSWLDHMLLQNERYHKRSWRRIGFFRHAREYCALALMMLTKLRKESNPQGPLTKSRNLRYDETSMAQVGELIRQFSRLNSTDGAAVQPCYSEMHCF